MKKNLALGVTAAALVASALPVSAAPQDVQASTPEDQEVGKKIYLSDLDYEQSMTTAYQNKVVNDGNYNGQYINLMVDGKLKEFEKGVGTHAPGELVYNVEKFSNTHTRLQGYLGLDASQGSNGGGIKLFVYTSTDGKTWTQVEKTGVQKGNTNAFKLDVSIAGAKYVKIEANHNGGNSYDHASYGDLKIVTPDYVEEVINADYEVRGLKQVADYDVELAKVTKENVLENEMLLMQRALVDNVGYEEIALLAGASDSNKHAIEFLLENKEALTYFTTSGEVNKEGKWSTALSEFCKLYEAYGADLHIKDDDNFNLRLAVSIALAQANPAANRFWEMSNTPHGSVLRYETYQELVESGIMDRGGETDTFGKWSTKQFKELPVTMMRWVVDNRINDDEAMWLANLALAEKAAGKEYLNAYNYIQYGKGYNYSNPELYNEANKEAFSAKYGNFTEYFDDYGKSNVFRLWMVFKEGSICGGLAKTYANLSETFGRPSSVLTQPGHAATMTWGWNKNTERYEWILQNDVGGWANSGNEFSDRMLNWGNKSFAKGFTASYNIIATDAVYQKEEFKKATLLNFLAESHEDKKAIYREAVNTQKINIDAWDGLIQAYETEGATQDEYFALAKEIVDVFGYYPQAMVELLDLVTPELTSSQRIQIDTLEMNALNKAANATKEVSSNISVSKALANKYLNNGEFGEVATFSFDGENAGKIVLNEKYEDAQVTLEYSIDGGTEWIKTDDKVIELTREQLDSLDANKDIKVRLMGADAIHTIDLLAGQVASSKVKANDFENLLIGSLANLEFSTDGGLTWCDYVTSVDEESINPKGVTGLRFEGDQKVLARYKAYGQYLQSATVEFTFTANDEDETSKYVQQRNVKVYAASATQGGHDASQAVDGNLDNGFHTKYGVRTEDKHIIFEFDKPRYITALDYVFIGGNNGRMKDGQILASMDGEHWEVIKEFSNMPRGVEVTKYEMDKVVQAKYIKLAPTATHGNNTATETDLYFAMKEVRFFEDAKKGAQPQSPIEFVEELPEVPTPAPNNGPQSPIIMEGPNSVIEYTDAPGTTASPSTNTGVQSPVYIESKIEFN